MNFKSQSRDCLGRIFQKNPKNKVKHRCFATSILFEDIWRLAPCTPLTQSHLIQIYTENAPLAPSAHVGPSNHSTLSWTRHVRIDCSSGALAEYRRIMPSCRNYCRGPHHRTCCSRTCRYVQHVTYKLYCREEPPNNISENWSRGLLLSQAQLQNC